MKKHIQTKLNIEFEEIPEAEVKRKIDEKEFRKILAERTLEEFKKEIGWKPPTDGKLTIYIQYYRKRYGIARTVWVFYGVLPEEKIAIEKEFNKEVRYPCDDLKDLRDDWEFSSKEEIIQFCKEHSYEPIHANKAIRIWKKYQDIYEKVRSRVKRELEEKLNLKKRT